MLTEHSLSELQQLLAELEELFAQSTGEMATDAAQVAATWRARVKGAQQRLGNLQTQAQKRVTDVAKSADQALHEHPWKAVAMAAAAGMMVGLTLSERRGSSAP